jgi:hypothetical protein
MFDGYVSPAMRKTVTSMAMKNHRIKIENSERDNYKDVLWSFLDIDVGMLGFRVVIRVHRIEY